MYWLTRAATPCYRLLDEGELDLLNDELELDEVDPPNLVLSRRYKLNSLDASLYCPSPAFVMVPRSIKLFR